MRLNSWLLGVLFGILVTSVIGRELMASLRFFRVSGNKKGGGGGLVLLVALSGLALWVIGSVGVFFARLIQCSVSRQRECLADASAVQFTRNPLGLANALKRIGAAPFRNALRSGNRDELSHLLFSAGSGYGKSALFASHPPLLERIRFLDPSFDGNFKPWRMAAATLEGTRNTPEQNAAREAGLLQALAGPELRRASVLSMRTGRSPSSSICWRSGSPAA